jgi:L-ascorbate metabolism protein UlaG (beta-lactamase superfamily)
MALSDTSFSEENSAPPGSSRWMLAIWLCMAMVVVFSLVLSQSLALYHGSVSSRFDGQQFTPAGHNSRPSLMQMLRWQAQRSPGSWPERLTLARRSVPPLRFDKDGIRVTLIGHSSVLIQVAGLNLITDPVLDDQVSLLGGVLKVDAVTAPGVAFDDLPPIDLVLISHDHADHLDKDSLLRLWRRDQPLILTPLGVDTRLRRWQADINALALDWWEHHLLEKTEKQPELRLTLVPARHWSGRGVFDHNRSLWGGWIIESTEGTVYFAGDTGYAPALMQQLAARFSPIRLALLPIGGYQPEWLMEHQNLSPAQAVAHHFQLGATRSMAMHYGRFALTDEPFLDPVEQLKRARREAGLAPEQFLIQPPGRPLQLD